MLSQSLILLLMPVIPFDTCHITDDGRIDFLDVPIVFPAYRTGRLEASLHLNDLLFENHALYHTEHDSCPCVKGGAMKDHRGGEKLYHLAPLFSINVRANC